MSAQRASEIEIEKIEGSSTLEIQLFRCVVVETRITLPSYVNMSVVYSTTSEEFQHTWRCPEKLWDEKEIFMAQQYLFKHSSWIPIINSISVTDQLLGTSNSIIVRGKTFMVREYHYRHNPEFTRFARDWMVTHLFPSWSPRTIPADESALEKLEKVKFDVNSSEGQKCCAICKDDFEEERQLIKMPCSHLFHVECLTKWLKINCVCPLCRFAISSPSTTS